MISEIRNSVRSRISMRSKHLAQLEESKASLNEIKSAVSKKLTDKHMNDVEFPNGDAEKDLDDTTLYERIKTTESMFSRIASSKQRNHS